MLSLDLDEINNITNRIPWFSHNRFNLFSIYDADHVRGAITGGISESLSQWAKALGIDWPVDCKIRLVTFPRVFGYGFSPVSFYFIDTSAGEPWLAIAEVMNTFREVKLYPMQRPAVDGLWLLRVAKNFYVSPFSDPGHEFDFKIGQPDENWEVRIDVYDGAECQLKSGISGQRRELTAIRLLWYSIKYPMLSFKIILMIHWHALRLWAKKIPFFRKADRMESQLDFISPAERLKKNTL